LQETDLGLLAENLLFQEARVVVAAAAEALKMVGVYRYHSIEDAQSLASDLHATKSAQQILAIHDYRL